MAPLTVLDQCRDKMRDLVAARHLDDVAVAVLAKPLSPEEAIGSPTRRDYPILEGKERVIEATILGARGQAFTDSPSNFSGQLRSVLALPLTSNRNRAILIATMNALMHSLDEINGVLHCKDEAPERCAAEIAQTARRSDAQKVGLIGFNPSIADALVRDLGADAIRITDLNPRNIGKCRFGVTIWDGRTETEQLISDCDLIIVTGTTLVNGTFDEILRLTHEHRKRLVVFGITAAAVCKFMGFERWCLQATNE